MHSYEYEMQGFKAESRTLLDDPDLVEEALCVIFDNATNAEDHTTIRRIAQTYPHNFLERVLGIERDYFEDVMSEGDQ
jgi:hypothetical protein